MFINLKYAQGCNRKHGNDQERNDKHNKEPKETLRGEKYNTYTHKQKNANKSYTLETTELLVSH